MTRRWTGWSLVVTAEHGGNDVPPEFRALFAAERELLDSHRGWDPGTLQLARTLAKSLDATPVTSTLTRLLVDLNRSAHNPRVFSRITRGLPRAQRVDLLERYHRPHWDRVRAVAARGVGKPTLHLGVHSFTPVLDGVERTPDLALLYDPARPLERALATRWCRALAEALPERMVRRNNPYRGVADGLTTALRRTLPPSGYVGIEIEVNQKLLRRNGAFPDWIGKVLPDTLGEVLDG